ncbi:MAG: histidinol-phosphate transaminase [Candidatus Omnitrophota bacterium]|nr:histidinol-phosphate transaminase [Candidatus Omnitrophota bacterium]
MLKEKQHLKNVNRTNIEEITRKGFLRLDMNECPFGLPNGFIKRTLSRIDGNFVATYPGYSRSQNKIAEYNKLRSENICLANGSDAAIKYLFEAYVSPGDRVLLTDPTFAMYKVYCKIFDAQPITVPYKPDLSFPGKEFAERISYDIKMAVVVNPNNPTGSIIPEDELLSILRRAQNKGVLLIVDEAYFYFYTGTVIREIMHFDNLVVLRTFSKLCGMAGLRIGYAAANPKIIKNLKKVRPTYDVNGIAALFAEEILDDRAILKSLLVETKKGKRYLIKQLNENGISYRDGYANFILIKCEINPLTIANKLRQDNILVGFGFEQLFLRDFIRVTLGDKKSMIQFWGSFIKIWRKNVREGR